MTTQERRWKGSENLKTENWTFFYSSGTEYRYEVMDLLLMILLKVKIIWSNRRQNKFYGNQMQTGQYNYG